MEKLKIDITGVELFHLAMALEKDTAITVEFSSIKKALSAANGCGNKCRSENVRNFFTVHQWGSVNVTVTKTPRSGRVAWAEEELKEILRKHSRPIGALPADYKE